MRIMYKNFRLWLLLCFIVCCQLITANAQNAPTVEKVEPPNWWANYSTGTVRVLIRGKNLNGANVFTPLNSSLKAYNFRASDNGHYLFFDLEISPNAKTGKYNLKIQTK